MGGGDGVKGGWNGIEIAMGIGIAVGLVGRGGVDGWMEGGEVEIVKLVRRKRAAEIDKMKVDYVSTR